jgi:predicted dehydrogenase
MTTNIPIRVCLIGIGGRGAKHLAGLIEHPEFQVVAAADNQHPKLVSASLDVLSKEDIKFFSDYRQMFEKVDVEAVVISTPHWFHADMSILAMRCGLDVFVEKPAAVTILDHCAVQQVAKETNRIVAVGYQHVGHKTAIWLKQQIEKGVLGQINAIYAVVPWSRPDDYYNEVWWRGRLLVAGLRCSDGVLGNQGSHTLNQTLFFAGYPTVNPFDANTSLYRLRDKQIMDADDLAFLSCSVMTNDTNQIDIGLATTTALATQQQEAICVIGNNGYAEYRHDRVAVYPNEVVYTEPDEKGYLYTDFAAAVRREKEPMASLGNTLSTTRLIEQAYRQDVKQLSKDIEPALAYAMSHWIDYHCEPVDFELFHSFTGGV